ncbi:glycosyltransferase family 39 protein [bacterium]|nr:glycosyltransferase family 39 protein [bacterium]
MLKRSDLIWLFLAALAFRAAVFVPLHDNYYMGGTVVYCGQVARSIVEGKGVSIPVGSIMAFEKSIHQDGRPDKLPPYASIPWDESDTFFPMIRYTGLYPLMLAGAIQAAPDFEWTRIQIPQVIFDALAAVWVALAAAGLGLGRRPALFSGALYALSIQLARNALAVIHDGPAPAVMAAALWLLSVGLRKNDRAVWPWAALGATLAIASYLRPNIMLLPVFLLAGFFVVRPPRIALRWFLCMFAAFALAVLPQTIRNYRIFGKFLPLTAAVSTGLMLDLNGWKSDWDVARSEPNAPPTSELHWPNPLERDAWRSKTALAYILDHKAEYLRVTFERRLGLLLFSVWKMQSIPAPGVRPLLVGAIHAVEFVIYVLFLAGCWFAARERSAVLLAGLIPLYFFVTLIPMHTEPRYFWPALSALYLVASHGLSRLLQRR